MFNVISIKQAYAGHAKQAAVLAATCQSGSYLGRFVVVVDDDIDPTNLDQVIWAMSTRCNPVEDIDILRRCWSGPLDPQRRGAGRLPIWGDPDMNMSSPTYGRINTTRSPMRELQLGVKFAF